MRHLFIVNDFPPIVGGQTAYLYNLCRALLPADFLVLAPVCGDTSAFDRAQAFRIIRKPYLSRIPLFEKVMKIFLPLLWVPGIMRREKIGMLHCAHVLSTGFVGLILKKVYGIDYVIYTYCADILEYRDHVFWRFWLRRILLGARHVVTLSHFTRDRLVELGVRPEKIVVSLPRIDTEEFTGSGEAEILRAQGLEGKRIILSVGRLVERKGNDMTIRAMTLVREKFPNAVYVIFGPGPYAGRLHVLVHELKLEDAVVFIGYGEPVKRALLRSCEIFAMVSRAIKERGDVEGFGIVFLEAAACGKPSVAGNSGGVPDAVVDNVTGILVPPEDPVAVAQAIIRLLSEEGLRHQMGEAALARVRSDFDYRRGVPELRKIFNGEGDGDGDVTLNVSSLSPSP